MKEVKSSLKRNHEFQGLRKEKEMHRNAFQLIFPAWVINHPWKDVFSKIVQAIYCPP